MVYIIECTTTRTGRDTAFIDHCCIVANDHLAVFELRHSRECQLEGHAPGRQGVDIGGWLLDARAVADRLALALFDIDNLTL